MWLVCLLLAAGAAWLTRRTMNPDGISYLDLADAWRHGQWDHALSEYWSPLYSWLLGLWLTLVQPAPGSMRPGVQITRRAWRPFRARGGSQSIRAGARSRLQP